jgi:ABC-type siderophore export system fused ATPase/permease subunit
VKLPPLLVYSVLRLLAFLVPLAVMWLFPILREYWWLTAIFAALIGLSISFLFLRRPLSSASTDLHERRQARAADRKVDEDVEDAADPA